MHLEFSSSSEEYLVGFTNMWISLYFLVYVINDTALRRVHTTSNCWERLNIVACMESLKRGRLSGVCLTLP